VLESGWPRHLLTAADTVGARLALLCELSVRGLGVSCASVQLVAEPPHRVGVHATDAVAAAAASEVVARIPHHCFGRTLDQPKVTPNVFSQSWTTLMSTRCSPSR
jgi:hypothetical protein